MSLAKLAKTINAIRQGTIKPPATSPLSALAKLVDKRLGGGDWATTRQSGQRIRRAYTDRLQVDLGNNGDEYRNATNETYKAILGMDADEIRASRQPRKGTDPTIARNYLTANELKKVAETERQIASLPK